ncbi:MAG TPA: acyltransferase [Labilithrix sp.]|nr:acyltransferase [Labilithrix sp.]
MDATSGPKAATPPRTGSSRLAAIDALRGVAALAVLVSHLPFSASTRPAADGGVLPVSVFPAWLDIVFAHGMYGVHLFLIISGFCIHMAWARQGDDTTRVGFGQFWRRRLHRLYPPYFVALLLTIAGLYVLHTFIGGEHGSIAARLGYADNSQLALDLVLLLLLAQNVNDASRRIGNGPFWTLALEEQLYALYFPLLWMRRRWGWTRTLIVVTGVTLAWRTVAAYALPDWPTLIFLGPSRWLEWVLGSLAVEAYLGRVQLPAWCRSGTVGTLLLGLAVVAGNAHRFGVPSAPLVPFTDALFGVALFTLVNAACEARWAEPGRGLIGRFFGWVGTFSYSLYLTHELVIVGAKQAGLRAGLSTAGIVMLRIGLPILAGWLFYVVVERRFLSSSRRSAKAAGAAGLAGS